jgi:EAL domain-containing protein (putative c-di-GMP-specific phosphodiesterase class I)/GGDEF domain-containing protein
MAVSNTDRLREDRDRFVGFAFANADLLLELDAESRVQWAGGAVKSILGEEPERVIGQPLIKILADHDAILLRAALKDLKPGQRQRDLNLLLQRRSDTQESVEVCIYRALDNGAPRFYLSITLAPVLLARQIAAKQRDRVTGLLEAVEFTQAATNAVQMARQSGKSACMTLIEICEEAELGRLLGPERSGALLAEIGAQLKIHAVDHDAAGRIGDGKFSVTHLEGEDPTAISEAINRVGDSFDLDRAALKVKEKTIKFQANSLGDDDVEGILSYIVGKFGASGSAGVASGSADDFLRKMTAETLSRVVAMRDIIHERRITLHYQPIVGLGDRGNHHYEVLLRFQDGKSPFEDVKFAEEINIIHELDLAVTQGAIARIKEAATKKHELSLAVNMSARSLLNDNFLAMFEQLAQAMGKDRRLLIVEITESAKLEDLPKASRAVDRLRSGGHAVCLDDFGAGASSLPYLQQLMIDYVKIDGVYIRSITESIRERAIVQGVLTTCKCLGIKTVAEMIEKEDQHKCLLDLGVDLGQGWLYGRPAAEIPPPVVRTSLVSPPTRLGKRAGMKETWG